jgi:hypothetical protein
MRDRQLIANTVGWGRSVHTIQKIWPAAPRNTELTMRKIVERCFKLKHFLNLAIRFDGRACHFLASLRCIASMLLMR